MAVRADLDHPAPGRRDGGVDDHVRPQAAGVLDAVDQDAATNCTDRSADDHRVGVVGTTRARDRDRRGADARDRTQVDHVHADIGRATHARAAARSGNRDVAPARGDRTRRT